MYAACYGNMCSQKIHGHPFAKCDLINSTRSRYASLLDGLSMARAVGVRSDDIAAAMA